MKPYVVLFAGAGGGSKTPIAHYLSENLGLPIFDNDAIRSEVKEDKLEFDIPEFEKRRDARRQAMLARHRSFIHGSSIDRSWSALRDDYSKAGYEVFIISLDISRTLLERLFKAKDYDLNELARFHAEHGVFLRDHAGDVNVHITDANFPRRLEVALHSLSGWLQQKGYVHG
jgi:hypothetical protein